MKTSIITSVNEKGQVVIPKFIREQLGIAAKVPLNVVLRGSGIYIYPVDEVLSRAEVESSYPRLLERTKGCWVSDDWLKTSRKRRKIELQAAKMRKQAW